MRKKFNLNLAVLLLCLTFSYSLAALEWGFKLGMNSTTFSLSNNNFPMEFKSRSEYPVIDLFLNFPLSKRFSLQAETILSVKGTDFLAENGWRFKHVIGYLEVPLLVKYKIPFRGESIPEVYTGPYFATKFISGTINIYDNFNEYMIDKQDDLEGVVSDWDYGLVLGTSIQFKTCFATLVVDIRYNFGLANILVNAQEYNGRIKVSDTFNENDRIRNRALVVMFGLVF